MYISHYWYNKSVKCSHYFKKGYSSVRSELLVAWHLRDPKVKPA